jgi:hypothetical protein
VCSKSIEIRLKSFVSKEKVWFFKPLGLKQKFRKTLQLAAGKEILAFRPNATSSHQIKSFLRFYLLYFTKLSHFVEYHNKNYEIPQHGTVFSLNCLELQRFRIWPELCSWDVYDENENVPAGTNALGGLSKMNDYFLRLLIRQRHAEILREVRAARLSRLNRPAAGGRVAEVARTFRSFLMKFQKSVGPCAAPAEKRQPI